MFYTYYYKRRNSTEQSPVMPHCIESMLHVYSYGCAMNVQTQTPHLDCDTTNYIKPLHYQLKADD